MQFKKKLTDLIDLIDNWLSDPDDDVQLQQWKEDTEWIAYSFEFSRVEQSYVDLILQLYAAQLKKKMERKQCSQMVVSKEQLDELLSRKQTEQRTPEWYAQMTNIISASELGKLFGSERERAQFVLSKTMPYQPRLMPLAVPSDHMSAFDWGIRFEPVVKQIYEAKYNAVIKDLGRMTHPVDPRCTASPDGLIYSAASNERVGHLIEIKCPVTREIDGIIPKDYYTQMQMQLHVTGMNACEYVEAVFLSKYNTLPIKEGPAFYSGFIAVIRSAERRGNQDFYYVYSPLSVDASWVPSLMEEDEIIEITPWKLYQWSEHLVLRNENWWTSIQPIFQTFWEDVEKAKRDEFSIPERASKKQKIEKCMIQFHKLDEHGN
uniref:YqaJ viral recombinase domain-containing protein n=1 Tax=viral metagenome TaxID=1070528 RepID=A0A6C0KS74_9ZZZZ